MHFKYLRHITSLFILAAVLCTSPAARAFSISGNFSDGCHEQITVQSYLPLMEIMNPDFVELPDDEASIKITKNIMESIGLLEDDHHRAYILASLLVGVRQPDTDGHSSLDILTQRNLHMADNDQDRHCLRRAGQDGEQGNIDALNDCRTLIRENLDTALNMLFLQPKDQNIKVSMNLEYYGDVNFYVNGPAYYIGMTAHTLQDSFSHTLRSEDLHTVQHVTNYVDALGADHNERRDGMAHSLTLDHCNEEARPLANAAAEATSDLFMAIKSLAEQSDPNAIDKLFNTWLQYQPGCTKDNNYCNNAWESTARKEQTRPILEDLLSCQSAGDLYLLVIAIAFAVVLLRSLFPARRNASHRKAAS